MPAPVSKDSMSKCDTSSMLYDTVRRPNTSYVPPKAAIDPAAPSKDTIETTQQRINREMMERFQNTSSRVPHHSFVMAAQVGKYLFLAIMLPPYICFFGIPRWLFLNAIPQIFTTVNHLALRIGKFTAELSKRVVDIMKGALEQLIGDSLRILNQQTKNLFGHVSEKASLVSNSLKKIIEFPRQFIEKIQTLMAQIKESLVDAVKNKWHIIESLQNKSIQIAKTVANVLLYPLDLADRHMIKPATHWCAKKMASAIAHVKRTVDLTKRYIESVMRPIISLVERVSKTIYGYAYQAGEYVYEQSHAYLQPYIQAVRIRLNRINDKIFKTASLMRFKTAKAVSMITDLVQPYIHMPVQLFVQFMGWAWWHSSQIAKSPWHYLKKGAGRGKQSLIAMCQSFVNGSKVVSQRLRSLIAGVWRGLLSIMKKIYRALCWIGGQLMALPRKAIYGLMKVFGIIMKIGMSCTYGLRLFLAFVWVICSCGMMAVRELAQEVVKRRNVAGKKH